MKKVIIKIAILVGALVILSSCSVYGTKFECKAGVGARCSSISKVNEMIDNGDIEGAVTSKPSTPSHTPESVFINNLPSALHSDLSMDSEDPESQSRTEEQTQKRKQKQESKQTQERQERNDIQNKPSTKPEKQGLSHKKEKDQINLWLPKTQDRAEKYIRIK